MPLGKAHCGHELAKGDIHTLCYTCRTRPKKRYPKFHLCQTIGDVKGDTGLCDLCCAVSSDVRKSWIPVRSYQGN